MRRDTFISVLLVVVTLLAYLPALNGGFVWDDAPWTTDLTRYFQDLSGLGALWFQPTALQQYYPLTGTTFWLDYQLWEFETLPYHIENVLLHAAAALLFWRLLRRLEVPGAWLATAIFALHPVMVQSAAWIAERKNVLSLVLYLGALLAYLRYADKRSSVEGRESRAATPPQPNDELAAGSLGPHGPSASPNSFRRFPNGSSPPQAAEREGYARAYALAFVLFLGALLAKTTTFSLPAVILLIAWWKRGQIRWRADVLPTLPFFLLSLGLCAVTAWLEKNHVGAHGQDFALTIPQRFLVAGHAFWFYLGKLFWPAGLCFVYPRWEPSPGEWWQWLYLVAAIGLILAFWLARARIGRGPVVALFFYVGTLFPVMGFMNTYAMRYSFVWDHWVYLPALGIIALVAALVSRLAEWRRAPAVAYGFAAIALPALTLLTWRHAATYANVETLWRDTLARNPDCWLGHLNLGSWWHQQGRLEEAIAEYSQAERINPNVPDILNSLGVALATEGRFDEAIEIYNRAIGFDANRFETRYNLGNALAAKGRVDEAIENYYRAIQIRPDFPDALNNLGLALAAKGRLDDAIEQYRRALELNPNFSPAQFNLNFALAARDQAGRLREAVAQYREALKLNPDLVGALNNLAWALATSPEAGLRNGTEAVGLAEHACELTHYQVTVMVGTLAAAYAEAGRFDDAVATARKACALATQQGEQDLLKRNQELLELYRAHRAYRE